MATAFDRRRIPAPEISIPPIYEPLLDGEAEAGPSKRVDRANDEARPIFLKTGLISQANGSGYIESGGVKIACSVYGPRPKAPPYTPQGTLNLEVKFAPFASDPRGAPLRDTEPIHLSQLLTQSLIPAIQLDQFPKSSIDIYLLILESDTPSNVLSAGLTVSSAAIADAGIAMNGLGTGSVVLTDQNGEILVDPEESEEIALQSQAQAQGQGQGQGQGNGAGKLLVGALPALGKVTNLYMEGEVEVDQAIQMIEKAIAASRDTHTVLAQSLLEGALERGIGGEA
ncbi:uncharacterized protein I303_102248 [Kwoniella dejecticola CBS 10117]|uniref:Exoribonuclease phosphorolytic domain-containing protein n=1 Tax=Kwoniella dejecticola CBS 10117 TaxID=1296121 RepID=A0A1A6ABH7_9TREE|nr:uncharacterized protein I303_01613 [Kwoniella dejecticola CBS 10117]OBR87411.1 hypothetical protein I303_01613 [Kwoniella dejecticola CBS 10117]